MRLFISIPLAKDIRRELAKIRKDFSEFPAKWVEEENLHITLIFIGGIGKPSELGEISDVLSGIKHKPINLETGRLSLLPNEKRPHVLAVKLVGETEKLSELAERIKKELREKKISFDEKPFRAHITLARLKQPKSGEKRGLKEKVRAYNSGGKAFKTRRIELTESKLTPTGPVYKVLKTIPLK